MSGGIVSLLHLPDEQEQHWTRCWVCVEARQVKTLPASAGIISPQYCENALLCCRLSKYDPWAQTFHVTIHSYSQKMRTVWKLYNMQELVSFRCTHTHTHPDTLRLLSQCMCLLVYEIRGVPFISSLWFLPEQYGRLLFGFFSPCHACDSQLREQTGRILIAVKHTDIYLGWKKKRISDWFKKAIYKRCNWCKSVH